MFQGDKREHQRFVVLSWKRTGSNLLCGMLHHHPEITMHNELFNTIDIFTYHPRVTERSDGPEGNYWSVLGRDLWPLHFLEHIWSGHFADGCKIKPKSKAVGFKSFPEHWRCSYNDDIFEELMNDHTIKKIILHREDELAVYLSMMRAQKTGRYMTIEYPKKLKVHIDPAKFQTFVFNYRDTYQRKYKSPFEKRDTFRVTYEEMLDKENFDRSILPLLWRFLDVDVDVEGKQLSDTVKQSPHNEKISQVISNYEELEFCFRHTDVYFPNECGSCGASTKITMPPRLSEEQHSWSILLPICSRLRISEMQDDNSSKTHMSVNRHGELERRAEYSEINCEVPKVCWERLTAFSQTLRETTNARRIVTEIVVGIDEDDPIYNAKEARNRIEHLFDEFQRVVYVSIPRKMYGKVSFCNNFHADFEIRVLLPVVNSNFFTVLKSLYI